MGIRWVFAALTFFSTSTYAANYATCILDKMPGTQNDVAANAIYQVCKSKHGGIQAVAQGSGHGLFSHSSL